MTTQEFLRSIPDIEEYPGFKMFLDQGKTTEARELILRQGRKKFGPPSAEQEALMRSVNDLTRLEAMSERLLDVSSWDDLLKDE